MADPLRKICKHFTVCIIFCLAASHTLNIGFLFPAKYSCYFSSIWIIAAKRTKIWRIFCLKKYLWTKFCILIDDHCLKPSIWICYINNELNLQLKSNVNAKIVLKYQWDDHTHLQPNNMNKIWRLTTEMKIIFLKYKLHFSWKIFPFQYTTSSLRTTFNWCRCCLLPHTLIHAVDKVSAEKSP